MLKADSWLYHLREMVEAPHPLKYIRRFVVLQEDIVAAQHPRPDTAADPPVRDTADTVNGRSADAVEFRPARFN
jgi:hypothetical protein